MQNELANTVAGAAAGNLTNVDVQGLWWTLIIIVVTGIIGGLGARVRPGRVDTLPASKSILLGVISSACVPLFLSLVQSRLIESILSSARPDRLSAYLILVGFCLLAAVYADSFLTSLSRRVLAQLDETKKVAEDAKKEAEQAKVEASGARAEMLQIVESGRTERALP